MIKNLNNSELPISSLAIRLLTESDIPVITSSFAEAKWLKPASLFETYLQEQINGSRLIWVAYVNNQCAGYVTLNWQSQYAPFSQAGIPEIMDLNVLPPLRNRGIASELLTVAEKEAATKSDVVGLGVGLYGGADGGYGAAQQLYIKHGYIPDGKGVTYNYITAMPGQTFPLDDDLILWLLKKLK